jgi:Rrf2 family protein
MNFSKTTSYSITVLNFLAKHQDERYSAKALNQKLDIPWQYLRQLLTTLSKEGFIDSAQGRNGGFSLSRDPAKISIASIVEATEGMSVFNTCIMGFRECPFDVKCAMHETWEETRANIIKVLKITTLDKFREIN